MIVFDASALVGAALTPGGTPARALLHADAADVIALSSAVDREISTVLGRTKFAAVVSVARREAFLAALRAGAVWSWLRVDRKNFRDASWAIEPVRCIVLVSPQ